MRRAGPLLRAAGRLLAAAVVLAVCSDRKPELFHARLGSHKGDFVPGVGELDERLARV